ncbi:polyadenylate-binding protein-interacting protein 2-like [Phyllopteryx taeniolatus]|uniref:polyadenylate-binding protein-interacting protein 2-like n=1 Tax=Phyllopteryx taeniolatus TaxID=161469 RepID=UPI002AD480A7|nr:polyadenylate-binding protein-interacting protein 2-like [Phyllopteryx taeniolatus]
MKDPRLSHATLAADTAPSDRSDARDSDPFAEYVWMEHEEEFDRQVEEELWEEDFMERCFQEMLDEEEESECFVPSRDLPDDRGRAVDLPTNMISVLNPNAKEFTPGIQKHVM